MRHGIAGNTLNRMTTHRKATVRDIAKATLIRQRICTTKAKAKEAFLAPELSATSNNVFI